MGLVAVVPAKASSQRVPNKNYRPFLGCISLVEILLEKLCRILPSDRVYLSCEDSAKRVFAGNWNARFLQRDPRLAANETTFPDFLRGICDQVPGDDDVLWCEAIDPMFDGHADVLRRWDVLHACSDSLGGYKPDSLTVVYPTKGYLLDSEHRPIGFGFGPWHVPSQRLPTFYRLNFTCAILTRESIRRCGYPVGERPAWYEATDPFIDIDTEEDFELAQLIYAHYREKKQR